MNVFHYLHDFFINFQTHPNMFGHHHHHGNVTGDSGKDADAMDTSLDGKGNHHHNCGACYDGHTHQVNTSSSCKSDSVSTATGNSSHGNGTGTGSDSNTGDSGGSQKRYCRCCYCELFGPNGVSFTVWYTALFLIVSCYCQVIAYLCYMLVLFERREYVVAP